MNNPIIKKIGETYTENATMLWYLHNDAWVYGINSDYDIDSLMICDENDNCDNCDTVDQQSTVHYQNIVDSIKEFEMLTLIRANKTRTIS